MNLDKNNLPIGVFDSGIGGLSVLQYAAKLLPNEDFIYIGDFANAPYGNKTKDEIISISVSNTKKLIDMNIKALLIACNTATSAAAHLLRKDSKIPIVGLEPAIKPAAQYEKGEKSIVVLATPQTLRLEKFNNLLKDFDRNIIPIACPGLSRLIEEAGPKSKAIEEYLAEILSFVDVDNTSAVVLGCTHFSFVAHEIQKATGGVKIFDGRFGAARQLARVVEKANSSKQGSVKLISTINDRHYKSLLDKFLNYELLEE
ncbi:MAG: glutamate racemase [Eubacteriales bacterium]